jgi:hypothetical protein
MDRDYRTKALPAAERELEAAIGRTTRNAAANKLMLIRTELKRRKAEYSI